MQIPLKSCVQMYLDVFVYLSALFYGDRELVMEWMDGFLNVHFGFTGALENFILDQIPSDINAISWGGERIQNLQRSPSDLD